MRLLRRENRSSQRQVACHCERAYRCLRCQTPERGNLTNPEASILVDEIATALESAPRNDRPRRSLPAGLSPPAPSDLTAWQSH